jgi:hypothetical protein
MSRNLTSISRLTPNIIYLLSKANITTLDEIIDNQDKLLDIKGIGQKAWSIIDDELGTDFFEKKRRKIEIEKNNKAKIKRLMKKEFKIELIQDISSSGETTYCIRENDWITFVYATLTEAENKYNLLVQHVKSGKVPGKTILKSESILLDL